MFGLLLCAVLAEVSQPGVITQAYTSLTAFTERVYKESPATLFGQVFITVFRLGTIAMALCLCFPAENHFSVTAYWAVVGVVLAVVLLKMLCNVLLDFTFELSRRFDTPYEHYANITTLASLLLYPVVLAVIRIGSLPMARWAVGSVAVLFVLMWCYRTFRTYTVSPMALLYLLLYHITLELLPMAGLAYLSAKTITNI